VETIKICPNCRKPLPADVPLGLCPECLIKAGFPTGTEPGAAAEAAAARFVPPPVAEIAQLFPQLEILRLIGQGGMGAVYKARQPALDRFVALKVLPPALGSDPGFAERFNREARALARLNHPNIVAVHDFGKAGALHYLLMEFVDGANLREIEQAGGLKPQQALAIVPQICEALQFAHNEGIVHRDIKPENLLMDKKGRVKITDFGIAKIVGAQASKVSLTGVKDVVGTPHYMAPEQIEHPQAVDHRADIYSLGVVFYEMLTGELPLGKFQPPSKKVHIDVRLDEVVLHTLEKEPERRYQHVSEVKTDVEEITHSPGSQTSPPAVSETTRQQVRGPAMGLVVTGIFNWVAIPAATIALMAIQGGSMGHGRLALLALAAILLSSLMIAAGLKMKRLEGYGLAIVAGILAIVVTPGNVIGLPLGIWALVVLTRREVREAFGKRSFVPVPSAAGSSPPITPAAGGSIPGPAIIAEPMAAATVSAEEILARDYTLNIRNCLRRGWALVRNDFWPLVGMSAFVLVVLSMASSSGVVVSDGKSSGTTSILGILLSGPLMGGLYLYFLKKIRREAAGVETAFTGFRQPFPHLVIAGFLASLLTVLGVLCLILPGVYLFVAWIFTFPLIIDRRLDFWPAMRLSRRIISKHWWKFLGFLIVLALINLVGIAACCVGLFITFPVTFAALTYAYEDITGAVKIPPGASSTIPPIAPSAPPTLPPDRFWRHFAVVMACVILIPVAIAIVGLLAAVAIPNFVRARQQSQQNAAQEWTKEGWQLWQDQKWDQAAAKFRQAAELTPDKADAWNGLGWATFNAGKSQEAEQAFQKAISLDTNQPGALNGLGQIYLSQGKYDLAETYLLKAAPQAPAAWFGLARLYLLEGKFEQAETWAQKIVDSGQADETARKMLEAAKAKKLNQGLQQLLEPPAAKLSGQAPTLRANTNAAADFTSLLNDDQQAVLAWTERQFRSFFDARSFEGWSDEDRATLERKLIDSLKGPRSQEYYQAINTLAALRSTQALPALREIAFDRAEKDNRDRWMATRALGIIGDKESVPKMIHLLYHYNSNTRWWAQISLVRLTGTNFAKDWNAWGKWWNDQNGQPPFKPEIIRWWSEQPEPDKLAESLNESDSKWLNNIQPQTGEQYLQQQLKLAQAGNYWAKFNLWEAFSQGKHEVAKNPAEADKWLSELVKGAYLAKIEPVNGFNPKTPKEMLDQFNEHCQLRSGRDSLGGASFFRTTKQDDKLIGSFLTASPDEFKTAMEQNPNLKLISMEKVTPEMFLTHEASSQESL